MLDKVSDKAFSLKIKGLLLAMLGVAAWAVVGLGFTLEAQAIVWSHIVDSGEPTILHIRADNNDSNAWDYAIVDGAGSTAGAVSAQTGSGQAFSATGPVQPFDTYSLFGPPPELSSGDDEIVDFFITFDGPVPLIVYTATMYTFENGESNTFVLDLTPDVSPGDIDASTQIDLQDAVLALKVLAG